MGCTLGSEVNGPTVLLGGHSGSPGPGGRETSAIVAQVGMYPVLS